MTANANDSEGLFFKLSFSRIWHEACILIQKDLSGGLMCAWQMKPVSFANDSLDVSGESATYTIQSGNTLSSLAKEIAQKTEKSFNECYVDILRQNGFIDGRGRPVANKDPNKISVGQKISFSYDESLSSYAKNSAPSSAHIETRQNTERSTALQSTTRLWGSLPAWSYDPQALVVGDQTISLIDDGEKMCSANEDGRSILLTEPHDDEGVAVTTDGVIVSDANASTEATLPLDPQAQAEIDAHFAAWERDDKPA